MSARIWRLIPAGEQIRLEPVELPEEEATLDSASAQLPAGAYTTFRTYAGGRTLPLEFHFERLEATARLAGCPQALDRFALRLGLRRTIQLSPAETDLRLRITLDLERRPGEVYIAAEPLSALPGEAYTRGVQVVTTELQRQLPRAKLTRFIERAGPVRRSLPPDANEAVMVDPAGRLLEGLTSNFFAVRDGILRTAAEGVLEGITRSLALVAARRLQIPVRFEPVVRAELPQLEEAFLTSASRGVLPVARIDDWRVGPAAPGPLTRRLMAEFAAVIDAELEPI